LEKKRLSQQVVDLTLTSDYNTLVDPTINQTSDAIISLIDSDVNSSTINTSEADLIRQSIELKVKMQLKVESLQKKRQQLLEQQKEIEEEENQIKSIKETIIKNSTMCNRPSINGNPIYTTIFNPIPATIHINRLNADQHSGTTQTPDTNSTYTSNTINLLNYGNPLSRETQESIDRHNASLNANQTQSTIYASAITDFGSRPNFIFYEQQRSQPSGSTSQTGGGYRNENFNQFYDSQSAFNAQHNVRQQSTGPNIGSASQQQTGPQQKSYYKQKNASHTTTGPQHPPGPQPSQVSRTESITLTPTMFAEMIRLLSPHQSSTKTYVKRPKSWTGGSSTELRSWIRSFENICRSKGWSEDTWLQEYGKVFEGEASSIFATQIGFESNMEWEEAKQILIRFYGGLSDGFSGFRNLHKTKRWHFKTAADYVSKMLDTAYIIEPNFNDSLLVTIIIDNLEPKVKSAILANGGLPPLDGILSRITDAEAAVEAGLSQRERLERQQRQQTVRNNVSTTPRNPNAYSGLNSNRGQTNQNRGSFNNNQSRPQYQRQENFQNRSPNNNQGPQQRVNASTSSHNNFRARSRGRQSNNNYLNENNSQNNNNNYNRNYNGNRRDNSNSNRGNTSRNRDTNVRNDNTQTTNCLNSGTSQTSSSEELLNHLRAIAANTPTTASSGNALNAPI
jgi:hypothetical protein